MTTAAAIKPQGPITRILRSISISAWRSISILRSKSLGSVMPTSMRCAWRDNPGRERHVPADASPLTRLARAGGHAVTDSALVAGRNTQ